jgi:ribosomal protein L18E
MERKEYNQWENIIEKLKKSEAGRSKVGRSKLENSMQKYNTIILYSII